MKFFPYELIASANDWLDESPKAVRRAISQLEKASTAYNHHLNQIRQRVSSRAWQFFRYGVMDKSLHDATLLRLVTGDTLSSTSRGHFDRRNRSRITASFEFLSFNESWIAEFNCKNVQSVKADLRSEPPMLWNLGDLFIYELRAASPTTLALGFLFASGSEIEIEFGKLVFRRRIVKREKATASLVIIP
jgi:hypothetical protein